MSNKQLAFPAISIASWEDIKKETSVLPISYYIDELSKTYHTIDVKMAMSQLTKVGELLQLAYVGSQGHNCSIIVIEILVDYQSLIKESFSTTSSFLVVSIQALKLIRLAIKWAEKNQFNTAVEFIVQTANIAGDLAELCDQLVVQSKDLNEKAKKALIEAAKDMNISLEKKNQIAITINETKAREESLKIKTRDLAVAVEEEKNREAEAANKVAQLQSRAYTVSLVSTLIKPVSDAVGAFTYASSTLGSLFGVFHKFAQTNSSTKDANLIKESIEMKEKELDEEKDSEKRQKITQELNSLRSQLTGAKSRTSSILDNLTQYAKATAMKETEIAKLRAATQKELREANASLAETVSKLQSSTSIRNNLDTAVTSLDITVKSLGKIVSIFANAKLFWKNIENHCIQLGKVDPEIDAKNAEFDEEMKNELIGSFNASGISWLALAKINGMAHQAMRQVDKGTDNIVNNLPSYREDREALIKKLSSSILRDLQIEEEILSQCN